MFALYSVVQRVVSEGWRVNARGRPYLNSPFQNVEWVHWKWQSQARSIDVLETVDTKGLGLILSQANSRSSLGDAKVV